MMVIYAAGLSFDGLSNISILNKACVNLNHVGTGINIAYLWNLEIWC